MITLTQYLIQSNSLLKMKAGQSASVQAVLAPRTAAKSRHVYDLFAQMLLRTGVSVSYSLSAHSIKAPEWRMTLILPTALSGARLKAITVLLKKLEQLCVVHEVSWDVSTGTRCSKNSASTSAAATEDDLLEDSGYYYGQD
jgi:hypothetical protein